VSLAGFGCSAQRRYYSSVGCCSPGGGFHPPGLNFFPLEVMTATQAACSSLRWLRRPCRGLLGRGRYYSWVL